MRVSMNDTSGISISQSEVNPFAKAFAAREADMMSQGTVLTNRSTPRKGARKEPEREFFEMTVLSF